MNITIDINGKNTSAAIEPRVTLLDFVRDIAGLKGTHAGCEHGVCGACTVLLDGEAVRSCLILAAQAEGSQIITIEAEDGTVRQPGSSTHHLEGLSRCCCSQWPVARQKV